MLLLPALTVILWKTDTEVDFLNFFLKEVLLVEKENNGRSREELVVADAVEQMQRLMHAILEREHCGKYQISLWGERLLIPFRLNRTVFQTSRESKGTDRVFSVVR